MTDNNMTDLSNPLTMKGAEEAGKKYRMTPEQAYEWSEHRVGQLAYVIRRTVHKYDGTYDKKED